MKYLVLLAVLQFHVDYDILFLLKKQVFSSEKRLFFLTVNRTTEVFAMRIGLLGFGVVGRGVYDITSKRDDMQVVKVLCLEDVQLPDAQVTRDFQDILNDDTIDTVVEAMGGLHPAYDFVKAAVEAGKNVVSSNKALIASFYDELLPLVEEKGVQLRCTAAVGGGIGWLSELERVRRVQKIHSVGGIMNGTCNYILDSMTRLGLGYDEALKQAQQLGYAEANPSTDIDGIDTWHKITISSNVAFGVSMAASTIPAAGIRYIRKEDVDAFRTHGLVCKLVSTGVQKDGAYSAYVQPTLFAETELESAVPANFNLITLDGEYSGRQSFYGQGAGRYPTAYNVVQDLQDLLEGKSYYGVYGPKVAAVNDEKLCYYVRGASDEWLASHKKESWGNAVITEPVSVADMHMWLADHPGTFIAAIR